MVRPGRAPAHGLDSMPDRDREQRATMIASGCTCSSSQRVSGSNRHADRSPYAERSSGSACRLRRSRAPSARSRPTPDGGVHGHRLLSRRQQPERHPAGRVDDVRLIGDGRLRAAEPKELVPGHGSRRRRDRRRASTGRTGERQWARRGDGGRRGVVLSISPKTRILLPGQTEEFTVLATLASGPTINATQRADYQRSPFLTPVIAVPNLPPRKSRITALAPGRRRCWPSSETGSRLPPSPCPAARPAAPSSTELPGCTPCSAGRLSAIGQHGPQTLGGERRAAEHRVQPRRQRPVRRHVPRRRALPRDLASGPRCVPEAQACASSTVCREGFRGGVWETCVSLPIGVCACSHP